ncbi:MAG: hypothetical protein WCA82_06825 [Jiangellales bacterium]
MIEYVDAQGAPVATQEIGTGCANVQAGALAVAGSPDACFGSRGFGDGDDSNSRFWLRPDVDDGESLTLTLSGDAAEYEFASYSLDIEARNVGGTDNIVVEAYLDGNEVETETETFDLSLSNREAFANYRIKRTLGTPVDTLVIAAAGNTEFQLEGDTGGTGSIFTLTDATDVIPCGQEGGATSGDASLTVTPGADCVGGEPVFFDFDGETVTLLKDPSDAEFELVVDWVDSGEAAAYPGRITQINYVDETEANFSPMVFCLPGPELPADLNLPVGVVLPPDTGWCIEDREIPTPTGNENGTFTTTETLYGKGDPRMR